MKSLSSPSDTSATAERHHPLQRLTRFQGRTAELATLRAQCCTAKAEGDQEAEQRASAQLARALARNGILLEQATKAARRSLLLADQQPLREELSVWFAGLGEASLACAALRPLLQQQSGSTAMQTLIRIAVLSARAGDDDGAVDALSGAAKEDPSDPLPLELLGAVRFWSESSISAEKAAGYYLAAAARRQAQAEGSAAFEDLLRALEMAPGYEPAASAVAAALSSRGRDDAADEVWRELAGLSPDARELHWDRLERSLALGELPRALGAAFDGGFCGPEPRNVLALAGVANPVENLRASRVQELLWQSGLGLIALCRLALAASSEQLGIAARAELWVRTGRAWQARFSNDDEAKRTFEEALKLLPDQQEAKLELNRLGGTDWGPSSEGQRGTLLSESSPATLWMKAEKEADVVGAAAALEALARSQTPKVRCLLTTLAAEKLAGGSHFEWAMRLIKDAILADPDSARAVRVHADLGLRADRGYAEAIERAVSLVLPRAGWCEALAERYRKGDPALAMAWAERRLVLCPGSLDAAQSLLEIAAEAGQKNKLAEGLSWSLSQPQPLLALSPTIAAALSALSLLDPEACVSLCRRALGVLGPKDPLLREALLSISTTLQRPDLGALVYERWFAAVEELNPDRYMELSDWHQAAGEWLGWATALGRALSRGAPARTVLERLERLGQPAEPDALFAFLEIRALALDALNTDGRVRALAHRTFAGACWDLASDVEQALGSLRLALVASGERAPAWLLHDLAELAGDRQLEYLGKFLADPALEGSAAPLYSLAASTALGNENSSEALTLAFLALERDASLTEALAVLEGAAKKLGDTATLERAYRLVSQATLGRFGERALHYRAARQFEGATDLSAALEHAICAFEAVPGEGVTLALAQELAERQEKWLWLVAAMQRVAAKCDRPEARGVWLVRAAQIADASVKGCCVRIQLLLEALAIRADGETFSKVHAALTQVSLIAPEERAQFRQPYLEMLDAVLPKLDGPLGARSAILAARIALVHFGDAALGLRALERAVASDADVEEFADLFDYAPLLGKSTHAADTLVRRALELSKSRFASAGAQFLELSAHIASSLGEPSEASSLMVAAARLAPDNQALVTRARELAAQGKEPGLLESLPLPADHPDRGKLLLARAKLATERGDFRDAKQSIDEALALALLPEDKSSALVTLFLVHSEVGEEVELFKHWDAREALDSGVRLALLVALTTCVAAVAGQESKALALVFEGRTEFESHLEYCRHWLEIARRAEDDSATKAALQALIRVAGVAERLEHQRQLARVLEKLHDGPGAALLWGSVYEEDPLDMDALRALEREAEAHGDYPKLVDLLGERAALTTDVSGLRDLRLRRARLMLRKLERPDAAVRELIAALDQAIPDPQAVTSLVQLIRERDEAALTPAVWLRLAPLAPDFLLRLEYVQRACDGFLSRGDVKSARLALEGLAASCSEAELLRQGVELERKIGEPVALAGTLVKLCGVSGEAHKVRALYLLEAARLVARAEDLAQASRYVEHAQELDPNNPDVHVSLEWLAYLARGPGSGELSQQTVRDLRKWDVGMSPNLAPLRSFLLAEALDVVEGGGAGMRELQAVAADRGESGLVALGLAERFAILENYERALASFDRALVGDLMLVRTVGQVLMRAAQVARGAGKFQRAAQYLASARREVDVGSMASELEARVERELATENSRRQSRPPEIVRLGTLDSSFALPAPSAPSVSEGDTLRTPPEASPLHAAVQRPAERHLDPPRPTSTVGGYALQAPNAVEETIVVRPSGRPRKPESRSAEIPTRGPGAYSLGAAAEEVIGVRSISSHPPRIVHAEPEASKEPATQRVSSVPPSPRGHSSARFRALRRLDPASIEPQSPHEAALLAELQAGSIAAGKELILAFEKAPERAQDCTLLCHYLSHLLPGEPWALMKLHESALKDRDHVLARAVQHVLALTGRGPFTEPPLLDEQSEQAEAVQSLLFRDAGSSATEAMALAWEGAQHVFHRDAKVYGLATYERVPLGAALPVGRVFTSVARALGMVKVPLYYRANAEPFDARVALIAPPSILAAGQASEGSREFQFQLGAAITAALPQYALLFGLPESEASAVLLALVLAFGPPRKGHGSLAASAQLAEVLWEGIPRRSQRRLQELCADVEDFSYEQAVATARLGQYRAGLFACGDLAIAIQQICALEGITFGGFSNPGELARLCAVSPSVADLVRLSSSPPYAEMRWRRIDAGANRLSIE